MLAEKWHPVIIEVAKDSRDKDRRTETDVKPAPRNNASSGSGWQRGNRSAWSSTESFGLSSTATSQKMPHHLHAASVIPDISCNFPSCSCDARHFFCHAVGVGHEIQYQAGNRHIAGSARPGERCGIADLEAHSRIRDSAPRFGNETFRPIDCRDGSRIKLGKNGIDEGTGSTADIAHARPGETSSQLRNSLATLRLQRPTYCS